MALLPGSPAINAGTTIGAPTTDQRGYPRPFGVACDIGAFEFGSMTGPPKITTPPPSQTAESGSATYLSVSVTGYPAMTYFWFYNGTNLIASGTDCCLELTQVQYSRSGTYTVVVTNMFGAVTSPPALLNVIAAVERRPVPGVKVTGEAGSLLNVDYANSLSPAPNWTSLGSVSLASTSQFYFDLSAPLPPQRFYRALQTGTPSVVPSLNLNFVPAITVTGNVGDSLRLDYINAIGPTDAWVTLDTVTLTNTSQLYFDVSAPVQPARLYRIVPAP
jgi:Immunoglobulin domain